MSDDHKDRFPKLSDGVSPDWRTWKQRVMPELYGKCVLFFKTLNIFSSSEVRQYITWLGACCFGEAAMPGPSQNSLCRFLSA